MNIKLKLIFIVITIFLLINNCFASNENVDIYRTSILEEDYNNINNILDEINGKLKEIDEKLKKVTLAEEYENYPTVRLNISTPFFGINSIIESKLRINNNVSLFDMISGYSIRDVVKKKIVKIPVFDVADIIVITKDIEIKEDMSEADAKVIVPYLYNYLKQVNSVKEFCNENIASIFKEFYIKEKRELMNEYFDELNLLTKIKNELNNNISYCILNSINNSFKYDEYLNYIKRYDEFMAISKNVFLDKEAISKNIEEINKFKDEFEKYSNVFKKEKENIINNISSYEYKSEDLKELIEKRIKYLENEVKNLEEFINNKEEKIIIKKEYEVKNNIDLVEEKSNEEEIKILKKYVVNSESVVEYLKKIIEQIKNESLKVNEELDVNIYDEENNEIDIYKSKELIDKRNDRYFKTLNIINNYTLEFINYEIGFYLNNIRNIYKDIDKNVDNILKDLENYKFMYVELMPSLRKLEFKYVKSNYLNNLLTLNESKEYLDRVVKISENLYNNLEEK